MDQTVPLSRSVAGADARHNALIYSIAQAINGSVAPISFTVGALAGYYLLGDDKSLATVPVTGFTVGIALGAIPAAALMRQVGRRLGFIVGSLVAICAGIFSIWAILTNSFWFFVLAMAIAGTSAAFVQQYRFAAADSGDPVMRARAISWVLAGGVAAAVIGPQAVIHTQDLFDPIPFAGAFLAMTLLASLGLVVLLFLRGEAREAPKPGLAESGGRPLAEIARQPQFIVAVICGHGGICINGVDDDRSPSGDGRLRPGQGKRRTRHPVACACHVQPKFLHRQSHSPLRQGENNRGRDGAACGRRSRCAPRDWPV
jgi:MFS family permease